MSLGELKTSIRMRDVITSIARTVVNEMRPEPKIGKVFSYDAVTRTAKILFPNEDINSLITAQVASYLIPSRTMVTTYNTAGLSAAGDIVRVSGKPGAYYVSDYIAGVPTSASQVVVGAISEYAGATEPPGFFFCRGQSFSSVTYPALAAAVGDYFAVHSGTTYYLPNLKARSPVGVGGVASSGSVGNNYALGLAWGSEAMQNHTHGVYDPGHTHPYATGYSEFAAAANWTFSSDSASGQRAFNVQGAWTTSSSPTGISIASAGTGDKGNVHPVLALNYIIKY